MSSSDPRPALYTSATASTAPAPSAAAQPITQWERRQAAIRSNADRLVRRGSLVGLGAAGIVTLTSPLGIGFVLGKVLTIMGPPLTGMLLRLGVVSLAVRESRVVSRRIVLRWLPRVCWVVCLMLWGLSALPVVNLLAVPGAIVLNTLIVTAYVEWTMRRERVGEGPHPLEWAVLLLAAAAVAALLVGLMLVGALAAWLAHVVQTWWESGGSVAVGNALG